MGKILFPSGWVFGLVFLTNSQVVDPALDQSYFKSAGGTTRSVVLFILKLLWLIRSLLYIYTPKGRKDVNTTHAYLVGEVEVQTLITFKHNCERCYSPTCLYFFTAHIYTICCYSITIILPWRL